MKALIENGYVVTMDARRAVFPRGYVAIGDDGSIEAVGDGAAPSGANAPLTIDASGMLVTPGLINAHTHTPHFLARGTGQSWTGSEAELLAAVGRAFSVEDRAVAAQLYASHLIRCGTTCILNHALSETSAAAAKAAIAPVQAAGLRQVFAGNFSADAAADAVASLAETYRAPHSRVSLALALDTAPHNLRGPASERQIEAGYRLAKSLNLRVSTRGPGDEGHADYRRDAGEAGRSHIMHLMELGVLDERWLVAMPSLLDETDISLMEEAGCHAVYTPTHDAFRGLPPAPFATLSRRINCALGSGGALFDPAEDMIEQIKACSMIQNSARLDPTVMPYETGLEMATINAARALGLDNAVGSLEAGKRADIAVFDNNHIYAEVGHKPISTFIATGRGADAQAVFVDGQLLLRDGQLVSPDEGATSAAARAAARLSSALATSSYREAV
jgi:5-methylthioadenosine/S-adenosylhomocysteine deaminase